MIKNWSLRQLLAKSWGRAHERGIVEEEISLPSALQSGDFKIDIDKRAVILDDQELPLSAEEFDMFVFLDGHRRRLVTPRTMLATRSTANRIRQAEFVRTLISLRKKLDAARPGKQYLRTEPWVLYQFDPNPNENGWHE